AAGAVEEGDRLGGRGGGERAEEATATLGAVEAPCGSSPSFQARRRSAASSGSKRTWWGSVTRAIFLLPYAADRESSARLSIRRASPRARSTRKSERPCAPGSARTRSTRSFWLPSPPTS